MATNCDNYKEFDKHWKPYVRQKWKWYGNFAIYGSSGKHVIAIKIHIPFFWSL